MKPDSCAYCLGSNGRLTKEHVFPASINRLRKDPVTHPEFFWQPAGKYITAEPQIGDVCRECNNGPLSALDAYGCRLYKEFFNTRVERDKEVSFVYDYHPLLRWLLKLSYNSARAQKHNPDDGNTLRRFREYILGDDDAPRSVVPFVHLVPPQTISLRDKIAAKEFKLGERVDADGIRIAGFHVPSLGDKVIGRAVFMNAFCFSLLILPRKTASRMTLAIERKFRNAAPWVHRLNEGCREIRLIPSGPEALDIMLKQTMFSGRNALRHSRKPDKGC